MKLVLSIFLSLLVSLSVNAAELSQESLQGGWQLLTMNDLTNEDNDMWEFEGNKFYQNLGGRRMRPDKFTVTGNEINLGYSKINVKKFEVNSMTAEWAGVTYTLKKK